MTVAAIAVAGVGAAATIGGSMMANKAQSKASKQAQSAQNDNLALQRMFAQQAREQNIPILDTANRAALGYVAPYAQTGQTANTALSQQMGLAPDANGNTTNSLGRKFNAQDYQDSVGYTPLVSNQYTRDQYGQQQGVAPLVSNTLTADEWKNDGTGTYTAAPTTLEELQATPGYKFQLEQGLQSVNNSAAAKGSLMSGATLKSLNDYAQGQASTGFAQAWQRGQDAYNNAFNRKNTRFQQGQEGYQQAFNNQQTQYQQGQNAAQQAQQNFTANQLQNFNQLAHVAGQGQNAAGNMADQNYNNAQNVSQENTQYAQTASGAQNNYANNTGNIAYGRGQNNANMYTGIGNSLTDLAGKYMSMPSNNTGLGGDINNNQNATNSKSIKGY